MMLERERARFDLERNLATENLQDAYGRIEVVARSVGDELANMISGIEGHAQLLCEAVGEPTLVALRAEHLWKSVRRMRLFSEKILSFSSVAQLEVEPIRMRPFLSSLAQEIETYSGNCLSVELVTSEFLPPALACHRALRNAALFLVDTLLALETRANRLSLRAFTSIHEDDDTRIEFEICAEAEDAKGSASQKVEQAVQLGYHAASNILQAQGATLSFDQMEGLNATCYISLRAAESEAPESESESAASLEPVEAELPHQYGGVLILEDDQFIRSMMAHELGATGRNIVSCVDGASARSLIEATPERFELLILDQGARLESGVSLATRALELDPNTKILLLNTAGTPVAPPAGLERSWAQISKPFGIMELRGAIQHLLGTGPLPPTQRARGTPPHWGSGVD